MTRVINVRNHARDTLLADPNFLYVGRPMYGRTNWKGSIWANPFKRGSTRAEAIRILGRDVDCEPRADRLNTYLAVRFYGAWLREKSGLLGRVGELHGKTLGCWCLDFVRDDRLLIPATEQLPIYKCHAVWLAMMADRMAVEAEIVPTFL